MRTLLEKDSDLLPIVPMHFRSPLNAMAHSSMSYNFSGGSTAPFASLLSMGSEDTAMALRWQVRHIGRAQGWPVLLSCLTVLVPAMSDPDGDAVIPADPRLKELSPREQQIFRLMRADMLHDEIMRMLKISPDTLCTHKRNILRKLGVRTPMGLLGLFAPELG
jgi:DNA-binding CsgD family transcriptional regulator